jgi:hypothetical protein
LHNTKYQSHTKKKSITQTGTVWRLVDNRCRPSKSKVRLSFITRQNFWIYKSFQIKVLTHPHIVKRLSITFMSEWKDFCLSTLFPKSFTSTTKPKSSLYLSLWVFSLGYFLNNDYEPNSTYLLWRTNIYMIRRVDVSDKRWCLILVWHTSQYSSVGILYFLSEHVGFN